MNLTRIARCAQGLLELLQEELHVVLRRQRTHHTNAEYLACERPKPAGDLNSRPIQKLFADFGFVNALWHAHCVQSRDAMLGGNVHAPAPRFASLDEPPGAAAMPLPPAIDTFF